MAETIIHQNPSDKWYTDLTDQIEANKYIINEYFDLEFTRQMVDKVVYKLGEEYFRFRFIGFDEFPKRNNPDRPLIFASNHSGMAFPWDGIILAAGIYKLFGYGPDSVRPLASPMLSESILMNPYLYNHLWKIVGSVDASFLNFETMLHQNDHNLLVYPEGVPGIAKGFNKRYQLQRFSSSFITMSIKYKTDVVPILTVNGEYINPYAYKSETLNKLINLLGVPFLPLGFITPFILLQPWIFYMGFPAKLTYVLGRKISPWKMTDKPIEKLTKHELNEIKERMRVDMQGQLDEAVARFGQQPYHWRDFFSTIFSKKNIKKLPYTIPLGWPLVFAEFQRVWNKYKEKDMPLRLGFLSTIRILLSKPFYFCFYIPILGWIPILIVGLRKVKSSQAGRIKRFKRRAD